MRKLTTDEVLRVLGAATYPMTTIEIAEACTTAAGEKTAQTGLPVRDALTELAKAGKVVSAVRDDRPRGYPGEAPPANPWWFLARRGSTHTTKWWMTPERAEEFRKELARQKQALAEAEDLARDVAARLGAALPASERADPREGHSHSVRTRVSVDDFSGKVSFEMRGRVEDLAALAASLAATSTGADTASAGA